MQLKAKLTILGQLLAPIGDIFGTLYWFWLADFSSEGKMAVKEEWALFLSFPPNRGNCCSPVPAIDSLLEIKS